MKTKTRSVFFHGSWNLDDRPPTFLHPTFPNLSRGKNSTRTSSSPNEANYPLEVDDADFVISSLPQRSLFSFFQFLSHDWIEMDESHAGAIMVVIQSRTKYIRTL